MTKSEIHDALRNLRREMSGNRWGSETKNGAPHKPLLLLSIMDEIADGYIETNDIRYSDQIGETFFTYWYSIFPKEKTTSIATPLYHMKSEGFWDLIYKKGQNPLSNSPSLGSLIDRVEIFRIDEELFALMKDPSEAQILRSILLETYFSDDAATRIAGNFESNVQINEYANHVMNLVAEPFTEIHSVVTLKKYAAKQYVRDRAFSKNIRKLYQDHCAICNDRVITPEGHTFVDGAHIIPWNKSHNDDPRNGLSLCKTHHWMFDHFMLTIDPDFKVVTSRYLNTNENVVQHLSEIKRKRIKLPDENQYNPADEALLFHNSAFEEVHKKWK